MNSIQALMGSSFQPPSPAGSRGGRNLTEEEGLVPGPPPSLADAASRQEAPVTQPPCPLIPPSAGRCSDENLREYALSTVRHL